MEKEIWEGKFNFGIGNPEYGGSHLHTIIYPSFCNLDGRWASSFKFSAPRVPRLRFTTLGRQHPVCITPASVCNTQKEFSVRTSVGRLLQFRYCRENFWIYPAPHDL